MIRIRIIVVGHTRPLFLREGEAFYLRRLRNYAQTEWVEIRPVQIKKSRPVKDVLEMEGRSITKRFLPREFRIALDRGGKSYDSEGLAKRLQHLSHSHPQLCFITGGPLGLSEEILKGVGEIFSLTPLTLPHEMCRLLLLEQLYRAFTIMHGEKYHK